MATDEALPRMKFPTTSSKVCLAIRVITVSTQISRPLKCSRWASDQSSFRTSYLPVRAVVIFMPRVPPPTWSCQPPPVPISCSTASTSSISSSKS
eukprot:CAMPEP_0168704768 /NCGR_PEP_ID=MMETSP0503-20121227/39744_1 /TAXON_ID=89963 /ORGANISM="Heterocapsa rotundata, Strain SCCAP K-0483" /LENGTH=94 /DNA_ID=CAMNT_0008750983 /DNA_START=106 /DNA_END=390 /DNA_ORIENTATION=+